MGRESRRRRKGRRKSAERLFSYPTRSFSQNVQIDKKTCRFGTTSFAREIRALRGFSTEKRRFCQVWFTLFARYPRLVARKPEGSLHVSSGVCTSFAAWIEHDVRLRKNARYFTVFNIFIAPVAEEFTRRNTPPDESRRRASRCQDSPRSRRPFPNRDPASPRALRRNFPALFSRWPRSGGSSCL